MAQRKKNQNALMERKWENIDLHDLNVVD